MVIIMDHRLNRIAGMFAGRIISSPANRRIWRGLTAQGFAHVVTIGIQLISVPVLLGAWGEARYGSWLLLSVLPTYLLLSDLGFAQAATNDLAISISRGDRAGALRTFQSLLALCLAVACTIVGLGASIAATPITTILGLREITPQQASIVTVVFAIHAALALLNGAITSGLRADGRFATMSILGSTTRLGEGLALLAAAVTGAGIVGAAAAMLTVRVLSILITTLILMKTTDLFFIGLSHARLTELRRLLAPSLGYMAFPVGYAVMIQGTLTIVGIRFPAAVALFATSRTLARLGSTVLGSVNHVFLYDYSRTLGRDRSAFTNLIALNAGLIAVGLVLYTSAVLTVGPWFYGHWTKGRIEMNSSLLVALVTASIGESIWAFLQTPLIAINAHGRIAAAFMVGAGSALIVGALYLGRGMSLNMFAYAQAGIFVALTVPIAAELTGQLRRKTPAMTPPGQE